MDLLAELKSELRSGLKFNHVSSKNNSKRDSKSSKQIAINKKHITNPKCVSLAIVGSRRFDDYKLFCKELKKYISEITNDNDLQEIVSGGAKGTDTMAERYAADNDIKTKIYLPRYDLYPGRIAPLKRNLEIVNRSTHVLAFPSKTGSGTQHTILEAKKRSKEVRTVWID